MLIVASVHAAALAGVACLSPTNVQLCDECMQVFPCSSCQNRESACTIRQAHHGRCRDLLFVVNWNSALVLLICLDCNHSYMYTNSDAS